IDGVGIAGLAKIPWMGCVVARPWVVRRVGNMPIGGRLAGGITPPVGELRDIAQTNIRGARFRMLRRIEVSRALRVEVGDLVTEGNRTVEAVSVGICWLARDADAVNNRPMVSPVANVIRGRIKSIVALVHVEIQRRSEGSVGANQHGG